MSVADSIKVSVQSNLEAIESMIKGNITPEMDVGYINEFWTVIEDCKTQIQNIDKIPIQEVRIKLRKYLMKFKCRKSNNFYRYIYIVMYSGYLHYNKYYKYRINISMEKYYTGVGWNY